VAGQGVAGQGVAGYGVAGRLSATGRAIAAAADHAYLHGMVLAALISAVVLAAGALLVLLFLSGNARPSGLRPGGTSGRAGQRLDDEIHGPADHALLPGDPEAGPVEVGGGPEPDGAVVRPGLGNPDLGRHGGAVRRG
jgi:hypothetical protein